MRDLIDFFADPRKRRFVVSPFTLHFGDDVDAETLSTDEWTLSATGQWEAEPAEWGADKIRRASPSFPKSVADSSVSAGLRAVAPDAARWHEYFSEQVEAAVAARLKDHDERLSRLEAAVAERRTTVQRADDILTDAIAALTAKLGADFEDEISDEEAAELWQLVDFSVEDEGE